ncbi:folate family ECF transporter S component [Periweissella beninensis]|uniref:Folate family ECF transporter S component n=1 Tax=Periweissella beninensis TaxID=504936 RepID=A0ABT0VIS6_9LACO|nr:folate family ECF transporter S component [Periweissella beninensis]MBM7544085.1 ECF transporter S component (folate family) [Periweissella beninensis]MCM2437540.1 folate family ECF transporter S component [Periweissella beninensis]MCT4396887.1 folate family ECF transporter S component [Periweissella beninensis]
MKTLSWGYPKLSVKSMALLGLLTALQLVLSRFSFGPDFLKFSVTFIVVVLIGKWFGPVWGSIMAVFTDYINTLLSGYPYFIGFALSAITGVFIYGIFFYNRPKINLVRVIIAVSLVLIIVNIFMNTTWVIITYNYHGMAAIKLIELRAIKQLIMAPLQIILTYLILNNQALERLRLNILTY